MENKNIFIILKHWEQYEENLSCPPIDSGTIYYDYVYYTSLEEAKEEINRIMPKGEWFVRTSKKIMKRDVSYPYNYATQSSNIKVTTYYIIKMEPK